MTDNIRHISPKRSGGMTIEDAKRAERLVEHLRKLRLHRKFLADKRATVSSIYMETLVSEAPPTVRISDGGGYHDGLPYHKAANGGWQINHSVTHGKVNIASTSHVSSGYLPTLSGRVMDGIRAAVADEIEETEKAITDLGFVIPQ